MEITNPTEDNQLDMPPVEQEQTGSQAPSSEQQEPAQVEIPVRKTAKDFYYQRQMETLKKQHAKELEDVRTHTPETSDTEDISILKESYSELQKQVRDNEINQFVNENPDLAKYKDRIQKFSEHPAYADLPTQELAFAAIGSELLQVSQTQREKQDSRALANNNKPLNGAGHFETPTKGINDMTDAEFKLHLENVKRGKS